MVKVSYADVFGLDRDDDREVEQVAAGDVVRTGDNARPQYQVLAVEGDKAWLRNLDNGLDGVVDRRRLRRVAPH